VALPGRECDLLVGSKLMFHWYPKVSSEDGEVSTRFRREVGEAISHICCSEPASDGAVHKLFGQKVSRFVQFRDDGNGLFHDL